MKQSLRCIISIIKSVSYELFLSFVPIFEVFCLEQALGHPYEQQCKKASSSVQQKTGPNKEMNRDANQHQPKILVQKQMK